MELLHTLPCVACFVLLDKRVSPVQVHHTEQVRDKYSDYAACPLCFYHHSELHRLSRRGFARLTGMDEVDLLKHTIRLLMEAK